MKYIWEHENWPNFNYKIDSIQKVIITFAIEIGEIKGILENLPENIKQETLIEVFISEAMKTSEIEGEYYNREDVMSSIKNKLGYGDQKNIVKNKNAKAISELMIEVKNSIHKKLTETELKKWHKILMQYSNHVDAGKYRSGEEPMQIISGRFGKEIIHFEAPPSTKIPFEMKQFVKWYNDYKIEKNYLVNAVIKTSISHLYFETIHPFEDGNGRIGRALAEKCILQSLNQTLAISLSRTIEKNKKLYYDSLKKAQKNLEITSWIECFFNIIFNSLKDTKQIILFTFYKSIFIEKHKNVCNPRQKKVLLKMFEFGIDGFEGGMTAKKYMSITKTSRATATRDLQELAKNNMVKQYGEGRNIHYHLKLE